MAIRERKQCLTFIILIYIGQFNTAKAAVESSIGSLLTCAKDKPFWHCDIYCKINIENMNNTFYLLQISYAEKLQLYTGHDSIENQNCRSCLLNRRPRNLIYIFSKKDLYLVNNSLNTILYPEIMSLKTLVTKSVEYNNWVVNKYINWLADKSEAQLNQEVPSRFRNILQTLNHILQTQEYWRSHISESIDFEKK